MNYITVHEPTRGIDLGWNTTYTVIDKVTGRFYHGATWSKRRNPIDDKYETSSKNSWFRTELKLRPSDFTMYIHQWHETREQCQFAERKLCTLSVVRHELCLNLCPPDRHGKFGSSESAKRGALRLCRDRHSSIVKLIQSKRTREEKSQIIKKGHEKRKYNKTLPSYVKTKKRLSDEALRKHKERMSKLSKEERSAIAQKGIITRKLKHIMMSKERRSDITLRSLATRKHNMSQLTDEERLAKRLANSEKLKNAFYRKTKEERSAIALKYSASRKRNQLALNDEERLAKRLAKSEKCKAVHNSKTKEERSAIAHRSAATRKRKLLLLSDDELLKTLEKRSAASAKGAETKKRNLLIQQSKIHKAYN